jgi:hypothetical protein
MGSGQLHKRNAMCIASDIAFDLRCSLHELKGQMYSKVSRVSRAVRTKFSFRTSV